MIKLFKAVQTQKIVTFPPGLENREVKELKKVAQRKIIPRFLTRGVILKLKKKQSINNALHFVSVAFTFYQNEIKSRRKKNATEEIANSLVVSPKVTSQKDKCNQNINGLEKHKPMGSYTISTKPIKVLQKKTKPIGMLYSTFLKIKPFFNVLQKFTVLLLKKNIYLTREAYPFVYAGLKGASTIGGFKKVLYNKILVQDRRLKPVYNRRKHNISHYMVVQNQFARLNKVFIYLGKNKLASMIGLVLKAVYSTIPSSFSGIKTKKHHYFTNKRSTRAKAIPRLVSVIEGQMPLLLWRNQFSSSLTKSRRNHRQGISQNLNIVCKNSMVVLLKSAYVKTRAS